MKVRYKMITNNLYKILFGYVYNSSTNSGSNNYVGPSSYPELVNIEGETKARANFGADYQLFDFVNTLSFASNGSINKNNTVYITVGTGTTEATRSDYNLEIPNEDITISAATQGVKSDYSGKVYIFSLYNPTSNDITVTEIGLIGIVTKWSNTIVRILLDRTVLDTPIIIPAGESKPITYEIGF